MSRDVVASLREGLRAGVRLLPPQFNNLRRGQPLLVPHPGLFEQPHPLCPSGEPLPVINIHRMAMGKHVFWPHLFSDDVEVAGKRPIMLDPTIP